MKRKSVADETLRSQVAALEVDVDNRDRAIRTQEHTIEELEARLVCADHEMATLRAEYARVAAEREHYRLALAEIEQVMHRLGNGCEFQPCHDCDTQEPA